MTAPVFRTIRRVEFADTDMAGIVHFANFFRFMEAAEVEFLRARGLSVAMAWDGMRIGLPRVGASCDFYKPARFQDLLQITVAIERLGNKSITYLFEVFKEEELIARGRISAVCCRVDGRDIQSIEIPPGLRARLADDNSKT